MNAVLPLMNVTATAGAATMRPPIRPPQARSMRGQLADLHKWISVLAILLAAWMGLQMHQFEQQLTNTAAAAPAAAPTEESQLAMHLRAAQQSVFLVAVASKAGDLSEVGTAWAVADHLLATNAHVALALDEARQAGAQALVRQTLSGDEFTVLEALVHPGFGQWQSLDKGAVLRSSASGLETLDLIGVCDVALLRVAENVEPLPLASVDTLERLSGADAVGYVGYPSEHVPGSRLFAPPTTVLGHLTSVSTFFFEVPRGGDGYLLQHDMVTAGGASGSPILNANGEVIGLVSAGSFVFTGGGRAPVGLNFGQRVDLLRELLDGDADELQADRNGRWIEDLNELTGSPSQRLQALADRIVASWIAEGRVPPTAEARLIDEQAFQGAAQQRRRIVELPGPGLYGVLATSDDWSDLDLIVRSRYGLLGNDMEVDGLPVVWFTAPQRMEIAIDLLTAGANLEDAQVHLQIFRIEN